MGTVYVDTQLELKSVAEKAALEEILSQIDFNALNYGPAIKIGFSTDDYLDIALDGSENALDEFDEVLNKISPCIVRDESFIVTLSNEYSDNEYLYKFTGYSVNRFTGIICFPEAGFYPISTARVIDAIKSNPDLAAKVREALIENN